MYNNVSEQFATTIRSPSRTFNLRLKINGKWINAGFKKMSYEAASTSGEGLQLGAAVAAKIELTVKRIDELFENTEIPIEIGLKLPSGKYEYIPLGFFTAEHPTLDQATTTFTAYDRMVKTTGVYVSELTYPASAADVLKEVSAECGIPCDVSGLNGITIDDAPVGYTYREVIGYIASLAGGFACVDRTGTIVIKWYEYSDYTINESRVMTFEKNESDYHLDYLTCNANSNTSFTVGSGTLGITFDNPLMTEEKLNSVYEKVRGFTYRGASLKTLGDIRLDPWDIVTVEESGETYKVPVMSITQEYDGGLAMTITAYGKTETETETDYKGPSTKLAERTYAEMMLTKELVAKKVDAEWVKANTVTAETIVSVNNELQYIKNNYLKSNEADIKYATIEEEKVIKSNIERLNADYEKVGILDGDVADIKTLMFGSASGGSLTTEFSNTVVGLIGDAQIKSAMIESIDAKKIIALDINTTSVKVHSESGLSYWQDNTIVISDGTRTRVQLGKDASADYNMYIWDKAGNLMFDALGLTDKGIQREIIRDDMVSQDANISAEKLDIGSLFDAINEDGSHTLKSSKILIDDSGQQLNVAFKQITTNVETALGDIGTLKESLKTVTDTVTTQGTQLTVVQGQISSKVWQQDITTAVSEVQIGGRNLLQKSAFNQNGADINDVWTMSIDAGHNYYNEVKNNKKCWHLISSSVTVSSSLRQSFATKIELQTEYTFSAEVYTVNITKGTTNYYCGLYIELTYQDGTGEQLYEPVMFPINNKKWETVSATKRLWNVNKELADVKAYVYFRNFTGDVYFRNVKLEKGNKATDWTPAPEDVDSSISSVESKVTTVSNQYTSLNQALTSLTATVNSNTTAISKKADGSTVTELQNNVTALQADLGGFKTTVSSTYATKTEFDGLKIGGRNLVLNSYPNETSNAYGFASRQLAVQLEAGVTYTASANGRVIDGTGMLLIYVKETGWKDGAFQKITSKTDTTVSFSFTPNISGTYVMQSYSYVSQGVRGGNVHINWYKLEKGNKATDWTPAPEDYSTTIEMNSAISQSASGVTTEVKAYTDTKLGSYATTASLSAYIAKTDTGTLKSCIEAIADTINITARGGLNLSGNRFTLSSTNTSITANGTITCNNLTATNANLTGTLTTTGIGIGNDGAQYNMQGSLIGGQLQIKNLTNNSYTAIQGHGIFAKNSIGVDTLKILTNTSDGTLDGLYIGGTAGTEVEVLRDAITLWYQPNYQKYTKIGKGYVRICNNGLNYYNDCALSVVGGIKTEFLNIYNQDWGKWCGVALNRTPQNEVSFDWDGNYLRIYIDNTIIASYSWSDVAWV